MDGTPDQTWSRCDAILLSIAEEWDQAERDIKLAEQISNKVVFPSIKELRYAGRKLIEVLRLSRGSPNLAELEAKLRDVRYDCHRARHDAIDAGTAKIAADLAIMAKTLGYGPILKFFPDFGELHRSLNAIRGFISESRANVIGRDHIYKELENDAFPKIVSDFRRLQASEEAIKALAQSESRQHRIVVVVGAIESIVAVGLLIEAAEWVFSHLHLLH